jgi:hypothetical protein
VLLVPLTEAVKVADWPGTSVTDAGPSVTPTGSSDTVAQAVFVESTTLEAVTVTVRGVLMPAGAV